MCKFEGFRQGERVLPCSDCIENSVSKNDKDQSSKTQGIFTVTEVQTC